MDVPDGDAPKPLDEDHWFEGRGRLGRRVDGAWFVDVGDVAGYSALALHAKLLIWLLLAALRDRASQIDLHTAESEAGETEYRLWFVVDGEHHQYASPPAHLAPSWTEELKRLAGLRSWRGRLADRVRAAADRIDGRPPAPSSGAFRVGMSGWSIEVAAAFYPTKGVDRCLLTFEPADAARSADAREVMGRIGRSSDAAEPGGEDGTATGA